MFFLCVATKQHYDSYLNLQVMCSYFDGQVHVRCAYCK